VLEKVRDSEQKFFGSFFQKRTSFFLKNAPLPVGHRETKLQNSGVAQAKLTYNTCGSGVASGASCSIAAPIDNDEAYSCYFLTTASTAALRGQGNRVKAGKL
jgi:hypothetical protein